MTRSETAAPAGVQPGVAWRRRLPSLLRAAALLLLAGALAPGAFGQTPPPPAQAPDPAASKDPPARTKPAPSKPAAPIPDVWSDSEIADAKRACAAALKAMTAEIEPLPPIREGRCGAPAPVRLLSLGKKHAVKFIPAPTIACSVLAPLKRWIDTGLQPSAARHLDTRVTTVSILSSYSCRTRYGRKGARMSEHAFANALDIGTFRLADGGKVSVLKHWGPTKRDIAKALAEKKRRQAEVAAAGTAAAQQPAPAAAPQPAPTAATPWRTVRQRPSLAPVRIAPRKRQSQRTATPPRRAQRSARPRRQSAPAPVVALPTPRRSAPVDLRASFLTPPPRGAPSRPAVAAGARAARALPPLPTRRPLRRAVKRRLDPGALPARTRPQPQPRYRLGGPKPAPSSPRARFLREIHHAACRIFGTTLGPEANDAHRNHFHVDMFPRRRGGYCE